MLRRSEVRGFQPIRRPRHVHLSLFNRRLAVEIGMARGLARSSFVRLAAACRPIGGFLEQRGSVRICAAGRASARQWASEAQQRRHRASFSSSDSMELQSATITCFSDISVLGVCTVCGCEWWRKCVRTCSPPQCPQLDRGRVFIDHPGDHQAFARFLCTTGNVQLAGRRPRRRAGVVAIGVALLVVRSTCRIGCEVCHLLGEGTAGSRWLRSATDFPRYLLNLHAA